MEAIVLAAALTCADGAWILSGLENGGNLKESLKSELRIEIIKAMPDDCSHEEYNPTGRK